MMVDSMIRTIAKNPALLRPAGNSPSMLPCVQQYSSTIGTSTATSAIITSAMPSTPRAKCAPKVGIQSTDSVPCRRMPSAACAVEYRLQTTPTSASSATATTITTDLAAASPAVRSASGTPSAATAGSSSSTSSSALIPRPPAAAPRR